MQPRPGGNIRLRVNSGGDEQAAVRVRNESYGRGERHMTVGAGRTEELLWNLHDSNHCYDLNISADHHQWRLAGHIEDGFQSISDPANVSRPSWGSLRGAPGRGFSVQVQN